jgi:hypothetical protein
MVNEPAQNHSNTHRFWRIALRLSVILLLVYLAKLGIDLLMAKIMLYETDAAARAMIGLIITVMIGYAILLAIPFVPGVEIGIAILMIEGASAAPMVYVATVSGLLIAFSIGQFAPLDRLVRLCNDLRLSRAAALLKRIKRTPREDRLNAMHDRLPKWLARVLCDYRYVTLGLLLNMPGNIALGGGGGIMMAGGLSRLFQSRFVILTVILATFPVPLSVWLLGADVLH